MSNARIGYFSAFAGLKKFEDYAAKSLKKARRKVARNVITRKEHARPHSELELRKELARDARRNMTGEEWLAWANRGRGD